MNKILIPGLLALSFQTFASNEILEQNLVTLEQSEDVSTLVLSSCDLATFNEEDSQLKAKIPSGNLLRVTVAGNTYSAESIGLFSRQNGKCLLKMKNAIIVEE